MTTEPKIIDLCKADWVIRDLYKEGKLSKETFIECEKAITHKQNVILGDWDEWYDMDGE